MYNIDTLIAWASFRNESKSVIEALVRDFKIVLYVGANEGLIKVNISIC